MQETQHFAASTVSRRTSVVASFHRTCVIDELLEHSPAGYVRRPDVPPESPTLGSSHLQLESLHATSRDSADPCDVATVCLPGLSGLRVLEACALDIAALGEEHGHRVLRVVGKGHEVVLVPLAPAVGRFVDRSMGDRTAGALVLNTRGGRLDRHSATRRLKHLAADARIRLQRMHPHVLRHTYVTTMLDAGVDLRDVQIAARHADPAPRCATTGPAPPWTATPTTSSPPT